jgi:hypothetical protein
MFVTVIAMNEGFSGARRARRHFDNGAEVRLEVLEQDDDPPDIAPGVPDPGRIGRKSYQALRDDPRIKLLSDDGTQGTQSRAAYEAAKGSAEKAAVEVVGLKLEVTQLRTENAELRAKLARVEPSVGGDATVAVSGLGSHSPGAFAKTDAHERVEQESIEHEKVDSSHHESSKRGRRT